MTELLENEAFCIGVVVRIHLYQMAVIIAHERKEPLIVGDTLYYLQNGREKLEQALDEICQ